MIKLFEMKKSLFYRILKNASSPLYRTADTVKRIILLVLLFAMKQKKVVLKAPAACTAR